MRFRRKTNLRAEPVREVLLPPSIFSVPQSGSDVTSQLWQQLDKEQRVMGACRLEPRPQCCEPVSSGAPGGEHANLPAGA